MLAASVFQAFLPSIFQARFMDADCIGVSGILAASIFPARFMDACRIGVSGILAASIFQARFMDCLPHRCFRHAKY
jgi:hypothetical protein